MRSIYSLIEKTARQQPDGVKNRRTIADGIVLETSYGTPNGCPRRGERRQQRIMSKDWRSLGNRENSSKSRGLPIHSFSNRPLKHNGFSYDWQTPRSVARTFESVIGDTFSDTAKAAVYARYPCKFRPYR